MPNLKQIQERISSVKSTKKITQAMQLIATSKLSRAKAKAFEVESFLDDILDSLSEISYEFKNMNNPLVKGHSSGKDLIVIITSDLGLCAAYNSNIINRLFEEEKDIDKKIIISIGRKGKEKLKSHKVNVDFCFENIGNEINSGGSRRIAHKILEMYRSKEVRSVKLYFTYFKNMLFQEVKVISLLPFVKNDSNTLKEKSLSNVLLEPNEEIVINELIEMSLFGIIYGAILNSIASEHASRRVSMENATNNASDMIKDLDLISNRTRQSKITQEISEIVAGVESLK